MSERLTRIQRQAIEHLFWGGWLAPVEEWTPHGPWATPPQGMAVQLTDKARKVLE